MIDMKIPRKVKKNTVCEILNFLVALQNKKDDNIHWLRSDIYLTFIHSNRDNYYFQY